MPDAAATPTAPAPIARELLAEIRAGLAAATPGPWSWYVNLRARSCYLATQRWGRHFVMQFSRWGMQDAQPRLRVPMPEFAARERDGRPTPGLMHDLRELELHPDHNGEVNLGAHHPDARLIEAAPAWLGALLAEVDRLEAELSTARGAITWALGEDGRFPDRPEDAGAYWWRSELRRRAGEVLRG